MSADREGDLSDLIDTLVALMTAFNKGRAAMLKDADGPDGTEWLAHVLLRVLHDLGPTRATSVAESLQLDKSTVSRKVASLVSGGLLERRADPADGRASILVPTDEGRALIAVHDRRRLEFFDQMLADWDDAEIGQFHDLLHRFAAAYDRAYDHWTSEREHRVGHRNLVNEGASA